MLIEWRLQTTEVVILQQTLAGAVVLLLFAEKNEEYKDLSLEMRRIFDNFLSDPPYGLFAGARGLPHVATFGIKVLKAMQETGVDWFNNASTDEAVARKLNELMADFSTEPPRPKVLLGMPEVIVPPASPELKDYVSGLVERAQSIRNGGVDPTADNIDG